MARVKQTARKSTGGGKAPRKVISIFKPGVKHSFSQLQPFCFQKESVAKKAVAPPETKKRKFRAGSVALKVFFTTAIYIGDASRLLSVDSTTCTVEYKVLM